MIVQFPGNDFIRSTDDQVGFLLRELAQIAVGQGTCLLELSKGLDELGRLGVVADVKMDEGACRLSTVVSVVRDRNRTHAVGFRTMGDGVSWREIVGHEKGRWLRMKPET